MLALTAFYACTFDQEFVLDDENLSLNLRWVPGLETETQDEMLIGLTWALSTLGAELPEGSMNAAVRWYDTTHFELNLNRVGFSRDALSALSRIRKVLIASEEYSETGSINLGRFVMLTLNSTYHYYAITGVPGTIAEFRSLYDFQEKRVVVINSSITSVDRLIEVAEAEEYGQIAHIGSESGDIFSPSEDFVPAEFETLDMMANGQIRFGLYDRQGRLKAFANEEFTIASKPAKCLWCHEVNIQPLFLVDAALNFNGALTQEAFNQLQREQMDLLTTYRLALKSDLDYSRPREHERAEKIYEDFMEPTAGILAIEWNLSLETTRDLLIGIIPHERLGMPGYYHRKDVDALAPYSVVRVPESAREKSDYEPDFF